MSSPSKTCGMRQIATRCVRPSPIRSNCAPARTRQTLTEEAAENFARLALRLRAKGHAPDVVAHFVNRLVFCMFAEDVGLLQDRMFLKMLKACARNPKDFASYAATLFKAMQKGGMVGFERVAWFNGGLFDSDEALPLDAADIADLLAAAALDWSEIDPSILGTLFERGLDPDKRSQLGAHYTDRDKIMQIVGPVIVDPLTAEWETTRAGIAAAMEKKANARNKAGASRAEAEARYFESRLHATACGFPGARSRLRFGQFPLPVAAGAQGYRAQGQS